MPRAKAYVNGFTTSEVSAITGLSAPMVDYLRRVGYLCPAYESGARARGRVRYYSYRDLVIGRIVQKLRESGIELARLKDALSQLAQHEGWAKIDSASPAEVVRLLLTDGRVMFIAGDDGFLDELRPSRQRAFAFVVDMGNMRTEVIDQMPERKRGTFSLKNEPLIEDSGTPDKLRSATRGRS